MDILTRSIYHRHRINYDVKASNYLNENKAYLRGAMTSGYFYCQM